MKRCLYWTNTRANAPIEEKMCPKRPDVRMSNKCVNTDSREDCGYFRLQEKRYSGGLGRDSSNMEYFLQDGTFR